MKHVYTFVFILLSTLAIAQPLPYEFTTENGAYVELTNDTSLTLGEDWDDDYWTAPIGFDFSYMGGSYNKISWLGIFGGLGTELILGEYDENGVYDIMCPTLLDVVEASGEDESIISYVTTGSPGSRKFAIQWKDCSVLGKGPTDARVNFQVRLYEATNSIDFLFGPAENFDFSDFSFLNGLPVYLGDNVNIEDPNVATNIWALTGDPADPDVDSYQTLNEFFMGTFIDDQPVNGTAYHFEGTPDKPDNIIQPYQANVQVYPSIAENEIFISDVNTSMSVTLFDMAGNKIREERVAARAPINVSTLATGVYIVHVNDGLAVHTLRFIKK